MTLALACLAAAIWLAGGSAVAGRPRRHAARRSDESARGLPIVAGVATAASCFALSASSTGVVLAAMLAPTAVAIVGRLVRRQRDSVPETELAWLPLVLDLVGTGLLAGLPLSAALMAAAPDQQPWLATQLRQVAGMLRLGADPVAAWAPLARDERLRPVAATAIRGAVSGIKLAAGFAELATELRAQARASSHARAQRAGVWVIAPLGLCFLPAFVCLGIIPVVIGILTSLRHGTPL